MNDETLLFVLTTIMELLTLAAAYCGLRLFKEKWQVRMTIIIIPLLANAALYLIYAKPTFFYLGVVLLLCIPFVWPRKSA